MSLKGGLHYASWYLPIFSTSKLGHKSCTEQYQVPHTSELSVVNQVNAMQEEPTADHKQKHDVATDHSEVT